MRLFNKLKPILQLLFPWCNSVRANKKIKKKIREIETIRNIDNLDYMKGFNALPLEDVEKFFEKTLEVKKSLEDKLKTSLFSVTIGITVLTSAITFLFNDSISSLSVTHKGVIFFTGSVAIIYMILAGIFAIKTISGFISVYQLFPEDIAEKNDAVKKESVAICAELNSLSNIIRQNLMNVSFHCIINSLFVIVIFFFLVGGSSFIIKNKADQQKKIDVIVHPNQNNIDLLNSKISEQDASNRKNMKFLKDNIESQGKYILRINSSIKEIKKEMTANRINIKDSKTKDSNK